MKSSTYLIIFLSIISFISCKKEEVVDNNPETITYMNISFHYDIDADLIIFEYRDLDGPGGSAPLIISPSLKSNTTYDVVIDLINLSVDPGLYLTQELRQEGHEHQLFFSTSEDIDLEFEYTDIDKDGFPIGLISTWTTGEAGSSEVQIVVKHKPNKSADNVSIGDPTLAGGITEMEATFLVEIID